MAGLAFIINSMLLQILGCNTHVLASPIPPLPTTSLPIFKVLEPSYERLPKFLPMPQNVQALEESTAVLECAPSNLEPQHTVSWLRSSDLSVLTVGSLVFSSDPRIAVLPGYAGGTWGLSISEVETGDHGEYQCQVNTEHKMSWPVKLVVRKLDMKRVKEIQEENEPLTFRNIELLLPNQTPYLNITTSHPITTVGTYHSTNTLVKDIANKADSELIKHSNKNSSDSPVAVEYPESDPTPPTPAPVLPADAKSHNPDGSSILLLPIVCFSCVVIAVIGVGSGRGLYNRWKNPAPPPVRPRSRTGTIDSRRSSASRRSQDSNQSSDSRSSRSSRNSKRRVRMKERDIEKERVAIYEEIRSKPRLSPLIELIEPTPLLDRKRSGIEKTNIGSRSQKQDIGVDGEAKGKEEERKKVPDTKVDNGQSYLMDESDRLQPQHVGRLASVESLAETEGKEVIEDTSQTEMVKKKNRNGRKIRFNPYDEFSD